MYRGCGSDQSGSHRAEDISKGFPSEQAFAKQARCGWMLKKWVKIQEIWQREKNQDLSTDSKFSKT